jgi:hypothetical protein
VSLLSENSSPAVNSSSETAREWRFRLERRTVAPLVVDDDDDDDDAAAVALEEEAAVVMLARERARGCGGGAANGRDTAAAGALTANGRADVGGDNN